MPEHAVRHRPRTAVAVVAVALSCLLAVVGLGVRPARAQSGPSIRAIGDSVTAGFGFLGDGTQWSIVDALSCKPTLATLNDRCSSNSSLGPGASQSTPAFTSDYGLSNGVSWPAQVAAALGTTDYQNLAVSGSEPRHWMDLAPTPQQPDNGSLHRLLQQVIKANPDLVLMTVGANPLLDDFLMGQGVACALYNDEATQRQLFEGCIGHFIAENDVQHRLEAIYSELLSGTTRSHLVVSRYHLAYPAIALYEEWQIQTLLNDVNGKVEAAVNATAAKPGWGDRIALSEPPRFDTGWPGTGQDATCGASVPADGPSHQSFPSQLVLIGRAGSQGFCASTDFWIISADTGIHPNREGHTQFANSALSVIRAKGWG